jgi:type I restriction enzyme S subunit
VAAVLPQQHRIIAKVDELMALCDRLETKLTTTQTDSGCLLEAVLHGPLAPGMQEAAADAVGQRRQV